MSNLPHTLSQWSSDEYFSAEVARLPLPPRVIVYEDDYSEKMCSVNTDEAHSRVELADAGGHVMLNFTAFGERVRPLIRLFLLTSLVDYAPATVAAYYKGLRVIPESSLVLAAVSEPVALRAKWPALTTDLPYESIKVFKRFISFFCLVGFGSWAHRYQALVTTLPSPHKDVYAAVRSGDCFLEIEEEVALVRWIDQAAASVTTLVGSDLRIAALVVCSYQFGMRPKQLGTLRKRDCEIRVSKESGLPSVYLTFRTLKQQDVQASRLPLLRKVKTGVGAFVSCNLRASVRCTQFGLLLRVSESNGTQCLAHLKARRHIARQGKSCIRSTSLDGPAHGGRGCQPRRSCGSAWTYQAHDRSCVLPSLSKPS
jgi:hypothetical protein